MSHSVCQIAVQLEDKSDQTISEKPSLLELNDHCLMNIFQFLDADDYVNLRTTCHRLRDICASVCSLKYKLIEVICPNKEISEQRFSKIFSVIGQYVLDITIGDPDQFSLDMIREKCKNVNRMDLCGDYNPLQLAGFKKLKELSMLDVMMTICEWRNCFVSMPNLESLRLNNCYEPGFMELLQMLPKLQGLHLEDLPFEFHLNPEFHHLLKLDGLTKLSFVSDEICNQLLIELAKKLDLMDLEICMRFDEDSIGILSSFRKLEILSVSKWRKDWNESWFANGTVFPPNLKLLRVAGLTLPFSTLLSIVQHLKFLQKFDVHDGDILWDQENKCKLLCTSMQIQITLIC